MPCQLEQGQIVWETPPMSDIFNLRSFVENQVERFASPKNLLVDKLRQTVDGMRFPSFSSMETSDDVSFQMISSESLSIEPVPVTASHQALSASRSVSSQPMSNVKLLTNRMARRQSTLRRHVSESSKTDASFLARSLFHTNPPIDVQNLLTSQQEKCPNVNRSRSLIRQSTDTTCTFPIRRPIRRLESIEIPGLKGVKSIRYINDDLGRLEPELYKKQIRHDDASLNSGHVTLTLFYNQSLASLIITVVSIDHLPYRDAQGKVLPNPFIKLNLLPDRRKKFQTRVYKHSQSIECQHETFQFPVPYDQLSQRSFLLSIYDFCRSLKRNLIGTVKIDDLDGIPDLTSGEITCTKSIIPGMETDPDLGELTVSLCYLPNAKRLTVTIVKANALKPMDINGKSDPYVKVLLLIHGKKIRKRKTSVIFNTLNPVYNESIEFDLSQDELEHTDLLFKVIDYDRVGANELIGCTGIGSHLDGIYREHWFEMSEHPRVPITESYTLRETVPIISCPPHPLSK